MSNKIHFALACLLGICAIAISPIASGQSSPGLITVTAPSPNASALGKYGEIPVSTYTGIPNISVPIYTLKGRELEVPITLNYHADGIRVEEIAPWVGMGWSLNAGGVITRTIRGAPDDRGGFFTNFASTTTFAQKYYTNQSAATSLEVQDGNAAYADIQQLSAYKAGIVDGEPDMYYYNFGKYTGSFFMNQQGQIVITPLQAIKVQPGFDASGTFNRWILTTPDGVRYVFGTSMDGTRTALESNSNGAPWPVATTGWYLEDIVSPHADTISFNYTPISYSYNSRFSEVLNVPITGANGPYPYRDFKIGLNNMIAPRLTTITSANGTITFGAGANRTDLPGEAPLAIINIYNKVNSGTLLEKWQFNTGYLSGRLTLLGLQQYSADGTRLGQGYQFSYNNTILPNPNPNGTAINSQDLWGYYNGVTNSVLPPGYSTTTEYNTGTITITGADRHSDGNYMQAGVLTKITYPTGGYSQFDYEPNTIYQSAEDISIPSGGGVGKDALVIFTPDTTVSDTFTITYPDPNSHVAQCTGILRTMDSGCTYDPSGYSQCYYATLLGINGTTYGPQQFKEGAISATLPAGTYVLKGQGAGTPKQQSNIIHFELDWTEYPPPPPQGNPNQLINKPIGGLRILRITNFDGISTSVTKYMYSRFNDTASSGVLVNEPYNYVNVFESAQTDGSVDGGTTVDYYLQVRSFPLIPLMPTQGAAIGYQNVTKLEGENGENGKEEYTYTTANDWPDEIQHQRPYAPSCSYDDRRGQLLKTTTYAYNNGTFTPVRSRSSVFVNGAKQTVAFGIVADCDAVGNAIGGEVLLGGDDYYASGYRTVSEFMYLQADTLRDYQQGSSSVYMQTINHFNYDTTNGHYQLIKTQTTDSKNLVEEKDFQYPPDQTLTGYEETARQAMIAQHIYTPVLDEKTYKNGVQTFDTKNNYQVFGNGYPLQQSIDEQVSANALDRRVIFLRYDNKGGLIQQQKTNDVLNTYIWDYNQNFPIAKVVGADSVDIAYTSFEANGTGNWQITSTLRDTGSITGSACYNLTNGAITKTGLTSGNTYVVSFWTKTGGAAVTGSTGFVKGKTILGWTYYEYTVTGVTTETVSGSGDIDELRLYPATAQMTTCTFSPLVGMTSQCDVGNKITYYGYDKLNRLSVIKDQDGNIIKTYQYHYKGQTN